MKKRYILMLAIFLCAVGGWVPARILVIELEGPIEPVRAEYVTEAMKKAEVDDISLILLEMDTPGGDVESMKAIVAKILNSTVPVAVYVAPSGAHAASAGFIILMAADVAVMAEGTNTGAAHPVLAFGGMMPLPEDEKTKPLFEKIQQDILAYLRGIVAHRGRNEEAAVSAVTDSTSYTAEEALEQNLIDLIANTRPEVIEKLDGQSVTLFSGREVVLDIAGQEMETAEMTFRQSVLSFISNPSLALILGLVGILGLFFEFQHPGFIFPGVIGGICLVLALLGFSMLPINYVGVILIVLAIGFFIAEIKIQGFGILGVGGIISLALGFLILVDAPDPSLAIPVELILGVVLPVGVILLLLTRLVIKAMQRPSLTGSEGLRLERGTAATPLAPRGKVYVHGEYWEAESVSGETIPAGTDIVVERSEGMRLYVRAVDATNDHSETIR